ncbi:phosphoribosylglycinamide formyltransferase [Myxococcota bacterium]|nr:phosphoribosylglycinamide formyltransferase [Myxococcota bacterium]
MTARFVVLVSGRGSNLDALQRACEDGRVPARVVRVVSNDPGAPALARSRERGIDAVAVPHRSCRDRDEFDARIAETVRAAEPDWVLLAGFMRVLGPRFLTAFPGRILNIHPSLLPSFPGLHTHRRALAAGVRFHGCTVHLVDATLDGGPIVAQAVVPVLAGDDEDRLAARVLEQEHLLYPRVARWAAEGRIRIEGGRVHVEGEGAAPPPAARYP